MPKYATANSRRQWQRFNTALKTQAGGTIRQLTDSERSFFKASRVKAWVAVLDAIRGSDDWISSVEIAAATEVKQRSVRRYIRDLATAGVVEMRTRRGLPYSLTEARRLP